MYCPESSTSLLENRLFSSRSFEVIRKIHAVTRWQKKDKLLMVLWMLRVFLRIYALSKETPASFSVAYTSRNLYEPVNFRIDHLLIQQPDFIVVTRWRSCNAMMLLFVVEFFSALMCLLVARFRIDNGYSIQWPPSDSQWSIYSESLCIKIIKTWSIRFFNTVIRLQKKMIDKKSVRSER